MSEATELAVVTGGGSGLGYAIAKKFVRNNIRTVIIGRNEDKLKKAKDSLGELCQWISFDLNELNKLPQLVEEINRNFGHIDILVNNAGIHLKKPLGEVTNEEFQQVILTNLTAVFALSRDVSQGMVKRKKGAIVNISSMAAKYGIPKIIAYTAAKSAIEGMTKAMAVELSPVGVRVNCVAPGFIKTDMSSKALNNDPERKNRVISRTPMAELGLPEDVAEAVYFLSTPSAKYITGTTITVDGGNSIGF
ncbi:MAG: SDR family NAD(P)-dependent oxidoreductase [Candidatus Cyclobacteriaceae bacterium M2_1C_046]